MSENTEQYASPREGGSFTNEWKKAEVFGPELDEDEMIFFLVAPSGYQITRIDESDTGVYLDKVGNTKFNAYQQDSHLVRIVAKRRKDNVDV